jgi:large subunit ribosomal protein L35
VPKTKTHKAASKRFKRRNSGSIARGRTPRGHKLTKKSSKRKRHMRADAAVSSADIHRVGRMLACSI